MGATATKKGPSYTVEVYGPLDGNYTGKVCCDGQPIGWVWGCGSEGEAQQHAVATVKRHQAGAVTLDVPLLTAGP